MYKYRKKLLEYLEKMKIEKDMPEQSMIRFYRPIVTNFIDDHLEKKYNDTPIGDITQHVIDEYFSMLSTKFKNNTIINKYRALKIFFNYLNKVKVLSQNIFLYFEINQYLSDEDTEYSNNLLSKNDRNKIYAYINDNSNDLRKRLLLGLVMYQGLKRAEICLLKSSDIDFELNYMYTVADGNHKKATGEDYVEKILSLKVRELLIEYLKINNIDSDKPILEFKSATDATINSEVGKITYEIVNKNITPMNLQKGYKFFLIEKNKTQVNLVADFLGKSLSTIEDNIKEYSLIERIDIEEDIRKMVDSIESV